MTTEVNVLTISRYFYWRQKLMTSPIISRYSLQTALIRKGIGIVQPRSPILSNTMNRRTTTDIVKYKARTRTVIPAHDRVINAQTQQAGKANNKIPEPSGLQIIKEKQQENVAILLEHQNEKQQALQQRELEWLADKIKMFTEEEQKAILASACAFAEHGLIIIPLTTIQLTNTCSQQDLMYFVCSAFFNMGKKCSDIVSFLSQVFPLYFPAGESVLAKKMPGWERVKERREKECN